MSTRGYSDAVNHALAFAAKHHDRQVWKGGARLPYFTQPANVAVILSKYDCDDDTIVAGILYDGVNDSVRVVSLREIPWAIPCPTNPRCTHHVFP